MSPQGRQEDPGCAQGEQTLLQSFVLVAKACPDQETDPKALPPEAKYVH